MARTMILTLFSLMAIGLLVPAAAQAVPSPLDQLRDGTPLDQIQCSGEKVLLQKNAKPYCVSDETALKLLERGGFFAVKQLSDDAPPGEAIQKQKDATGPAAITAEPAGPLHDESTNAPSSQPYEDDDPGHLQPGPAAREPVDTATTTQPATNHTYAKESPDTTTQPTKNHTSAKDYILTVANGKITLKNFERIPDPDAVWFPMPHEDAIDVMQRLAKGFDDKVTFPLERETTVDYAYATENNGVFQLNKVYQPKIWGGLQVIGKPNLISSISYYTPKSIPFDEHEEFMRSVLNKAGFYNIDNIYSNGPGYDGDYSSMVSGNGGKFHIHSWFGYKFHWFDAMTAGMRFSGWSNLDRSTHSIYPSVSETFELVDRAHEFVDKHKHLFDCRYVEETTYKYSGYQYYVRSGILFLKVDVGNCHVDDARWRAIVYVTMAPMNDDVMWFSGGSSRNILKYLPDDWTEHIYIPDYAKASINE